jgi:hypothetical protein
LSRSSSFSASQEIRSILLNFEFYYFFHKSLPLECVWSQMNPAHVLPSCSYKIHFIILPPKCLSTDIIFSPPPPRTKDLYKFFFSRICAKFLVYFTAIDLFTKGFLTMKHLSGKRKSKFPQDTLLYAAKFTF